MTLGDILEQRKDFARFKAMAQGELVTPPSLPAPTSQVPGIIASPAVPKRGRPPGSREERDHIAAYLGEWLLQFNDQAPAVSSISRALNDFKAASVPREQWGDYLHQAKSILRENQAKVTTKAVKQTNGMQPKNLTPYYFEILEDLLGLREGTSPSTTTANAP
jgi:hypothetical protein